MYKMTTVASEKDLLLDALGCSRETWILARYGSDTIDIRKLQYTILFSTRFIPR